jgi:hypothetical protein
MMATRRKSRTLSEHREWIIPVPKLLPYMEQEPASSESWRYPNGNILSLLQMWFSIPYWDVLLEEGVYGIRACVHSD